MVETDTSSVSHKLRRRLVLILVLGVVGMLGMVLVSLCMGTVNYPPSVVIDSLVNVFNNGVQSGLDRTIYNLRLPRVLAAFAVGAGLAVAGIVFQAIIRNPLVDPYMTGVSSGAGLGASLYMVFFASAAFVGYNYAMPLFAFVFATAAFMLTFGISRLSGNTNVSFVLAGVIAAMGFSAMTTILMLTNESKTHGILGFLYGSFSSVSWETAMIMIVPVVVISLIFMLYSRTFNVVLLGREQSMELGVNYDRFRLLSMLLASFLTAVCVSFVGIIGFVGLIVPHIARMALGGDHRLIIPASIIMGALLLAGADILIKELINVAGITVPVGAITTLIGIPFFIYIMKRRGKGYA
ncbi:MAG: iron ABC transporter permease [Candidatus Methanomethylophilaceae archaeon]|nr:iron ABC transporter permease [Candidatus Methanomethylophilaceae archaeon]